MKKRFFRIPTISEKKQKGLVNSTLEDVLNQNSLQTHVLRASSLLFGTNPNGHLKWIKEGFYPGIPQPKLVKNIPEDVHLQQLIREHFSKGNLHDAIGFSIQPIAWLRNYGTRSCYSYVSIAQGIERFVYASIFANMSLEEEYSDGLNAKEQGAKIRVNVPSTSAKSRRYVLDFSRIPFYEGDHLKQALSINARFDKRVPENHAHIISFKYPSKRFISREQIAGNIFLAQAYGLQGNVLPRKNLPFPLFAPEIMDLYMFCRHSVLVESKKQSYRNLREPEISFILGLLAENLGEHTLRKPTDPKLTQYSCFSSSL